MIVLEYKRTTPFRVDELRSASFAIERMIRRSTSATDFSARLVSAKIERALRKLGLDPRIWKYVAWDSTGACFAYIDKPSLCDSRTLFGIADGQHYESADGFLLPLTDLDEEGDTEPALYEWKGGLES